MCVATIGYCDCLDCCADPGVGKLQRVDFCEKRQKELGDVWSLWAPVEKSLIPCDGLTFSRQKDTSACHLVNTTKGSGGEKIDIASDAALSEASPIPAAAEQLSTGSTGRVSEQLKEHNNGSTDPVAGSSKSADTQSADDTLAFLPINKPRKKLPNSRPPLSEARLRAAAAAALAASYPHGAPPVAKAAVPDPAPAPTPAPVPAPASASAPTPTDAGTGNWTKEEVMKLLLCRSKNMEFDDINRVGRLFYLSGLRIEQLLMLF